MRGTAIKNAERNLQEQKIAQEIAYNTLSPDYSIFKIRPDELPRDVGVQTSVFERSYLQNGWLWFETT